MGYAKSEITMRGFVATFSATLNELGHNPDVIERALAHLPADKVRAAYHSDSARAGSKAILEVRSIAPECNRSPSGYP